MFVFWLFCLGPCAFVMCKGEPHIKIPFGGFWRKSSGLSLTLLSFICTAWNQQQDEDQPAYLPGYFLAGARMQITWHETKQNLTLTFLPLSESFSSTLQTLQTNKQAPPLAEVSPLTWTTHLTVQISGSLFVWAHDIQISPLTEVPQSSHDEPEDPPPTHCASWWEDTLKKNRGHFLGSQCRRVGSTHLIHATPGGLVSNFYFQPWLLFSVYAKHPHEGVARLLLLIFLNAKTQLTTNSKSA